MKNFIAIIILLGISFLIFHFTKTGKTEKPKALVKKECFWVGGQDGGYWVEILNFNRKDTIVASLYIEKSGDFFQTNTYVNHDSGTMNYPTFQELQTSSNFVSESQFQILLNRKYYTYKNIDIKN